MTFKRGARRAIGNNTQQKGGVQTPSRGAEPGPAPCWPHPVPPTIRALCSAQIPLSHKDDTSPAALGKRSNSLLDTLSPEPSFSVSFQGDSWLWDHTSLGWFPSNKMRGKTRWFSRSLTRQPTVSVPDTHTPVPSPAHLPAPSQRRPCGATERGPLLLEVSARDA